MWPYCEGDAGIRVQGEFVTRSLLAMRRKEQEGNRCGKSWDTTEKRYQWEDFLKEREEQDKKRRLKAQEDAKSVEAAWKAVLENIGVERRSAREKNGEVEKVKVEKEKSEEDEAEEAKKAEFLRLKEATDSLGFGGESDPNDTGIEGEKEGKADDKEESGSLAGAMDEQGVAQPDGSKNGADLAGGDAEEEKKAEGDTVGRDAEEEKETKGDTPKHLEGEVNSPAENEVNVGEERPSISGP